MRRRIGRRTYGGDGTTKLYDDDVAVRRRCSGRGGWAVGSICWCDDGKRRPVRQRADDKWEHWRRIGNLAELSHLESQRRTVLSPYQEYRGRAVQGGMEGRWHNGKGGDGGTLGGKGHEASPSSSGAVSDKRRRKYRTRVETGGIEQDFGALRQDWRKTSHSAWYMRENTTRN